MRKREEEERQMKRFGIFMNTYNFDLYSKMLFNGQKNGEQETIIHQAEFLLIGGLMCECMRCGCVDKP